MNLIKRIHLISAFIVTIITVHAEVIKNADEVFNKWRETQQIMPAIDLAAQGQSLDDIYLQAFKQKYEKTASVLTPMLPMLHAMTAGHVNEHGYILRTPINLDLKANLCAVYELINNDMNMFVQFLQSVNCVTQNKDAAIRNAQEDIEKNNALFQLLFAHPQEDMSNQMLFTVANRFFEYCFEEQSFPMFQKMLLNKSSHETARLLYAVLWYNLAGNGWKHWHQDSLKALKEKADQGHQISYIAGGSDLYQLIKAGIYNIRNIDPQLPSQPKYYTNDWQFILRGDTSDGGVGDKIVFNFGTHTIIMERIEFQLMGGATFKARIASGEIIELPKSVTTWAIKDAEGNRLGQYILERRFCDQSDFVTVPQKTFLMSFNELYFIAMPVALGGWGIQTVQFPDNLSMIIKQLRKPVTRQMINNMHIATLLNNSDFKFIALGSCIN